VLLIVGGDSDPNTSRIVDQAHIRNVEYLFWDTDLTSSLQVAWDFESPALDLGHTRIEPTAIFARWNVFGGDPSRNLAAYETIQAYAFAWPSIRMLNRQSISDLNNKSFNLRLAREIGFTIPHSIVMSDLSPLTTLPNPDQKITKPLGGGGHARLVSDLVQDPKAIAESGPQFLQERLEGENLRLFSVNQQLSCFHLITTKLDYREDPLTDVVQVDVPDELISMTHQMVERKGFDYCALDFRCRNGLNDPVFLEINSFPMFVRFDDAGHNCIANSILDFLTQPT